MSHRKYGRWYVPFLLLLVFVLYSISYADVTPVADRTPQVRDAIVAAVTDVDSATDVTAEHLSTITSLTLRLLKITSLASGDFSGLTGLTSLNLYGNQLSSLPAGIFEGLTSLTTLRLGKNAVNPLPLTVSLEKVAEGEFKAVVPAGATFDIVLPVTVANGSITGGATELTIPQGQVESIISLTVTRTPGTTGKVTVDIGTLPNLPKNHYGYTLTKSDALPLTIITDINTAPTFAEGNITIRTIAENVSKNTNIGAPITATDAEDDTLTWTLGGVDADSFEINTTTGQLKTKAPLDYETKRVYSVSLTVADEELSDTITVIISLIDVSDTVITADVFPVVNRTPQVRDAIVAAIPTVRDATQVTATHLASITGLNLRNKGISALKIGDFSGLAALTNLNLSGNQFSSLPVGTFDGLGALTTLRLGGNVVDPLPLIVSLQQVRDSEYRAIIPTGAPFPIRIPITVTDGSIRGGITSVVIPQGRRHSASFTVVATSAKVSIGMLPGVPRNHYGYVLAQSTVSSRTEQVATAIAAAVGARAMSTVTETDLATITSLDLSGTSLTTLKTDDFADLVSLTTLNLSNNALTDLPAGIFDDTPSLSSITLANNQLSSLPVGLFTGLSFLNTVDLSGNGITRLSGGTFSGLSALTAINLSNNKLSTLPVGIFEGLTSLNQLSLSGNTVDPLQIGVSLQKVGINQFKAIAPTGAPFSIVLPLERINGTVRGGATTIQIPKGSVESRSLTMIRMPNTIAAVEVDIVNVPQLPSNHNGYALVKSMTRRLEVLPTLNSPPVFTEGTSTTRTVAENTAAGRNIGDPITATDVDRGNTLTYTLGGTDAASFNLDSTTGQIKTKASLDYETKTSYSLVLTVSDGLATDTITVTINVTDVDENRAPVFTEGNSTTRTIAENTDPRTNIGDPVSATDADEDTLTYRIGGTDAAAFAIDSSSGQLRTSASLDYETKSSYTVTFTVSDGKLTDTITVTINVTDVPEITVIEENEPEVSAQQQTETNNPPVFTDDTSTTRSIAENTASGQNIGSAVSATDADSGDTLTYTLGGTDASSFSIVSSSGQLQTKAALDYENKNSYSITVSVSDGNGGTDSINVTINVTDVVEQVIETVSEQETTTNTPPVFTDGTSTTRSVAENTGSGVNIGSAVSATDADNDALTYTLGGTDANAFSINSTNGQLRTSAALDYENKNSYSITVSVSDGNRGTDSINVTINVTDVNENHAPVFSEGASATRTVAENTSSGVDIGSTVSATDADNDALTYTLGGTDANAFSINSTNGQLRTSATLDYENKNSYSITVSVSDGNGGTDSINVTINVTDVVEQVIETVSEQETTTNTPPVFTDGTSTTRSIAENTGSGVNIGSPVSATDADNDALTYTLGGTDASAFSINSTNGQLRTSAALDYENKNSYSITVSVSDGNGGTDSINVTINVTDVSETLITPAISDRTPQVRDAIVAAAGVSSVADVTTAHLAEIKNLNIGSKSISSLKAGDFSGLTSLTFLYLSSNSISDISALADLTALEYLYLSYNSISDISALADLTALTYLDLGDNSISDISALAGLTSLTSLFLSSNSISDISALADLTALTTLGLGDNSISDISALADLTALTTLDLGDNSISDISALADLTGLINLYLGNNSISDISALADLTGLKTLSLLGNSISDYGSLRWLVALIEAAGNSLSLDTTIAPVVSNNNAPVFSEGSSTTRSVAENTRSGINIGTAVSATDADNDTLTYTLGGTDAASFSIVSSSGQLRTRTSLDYESKASYTVTVTVSDGTLTGTIRVIINVSDIDETVQQNNLREDVWMPDVHLRFAVRTALDIGSEALTQTKMLELTSLTAQNAFISNLKGLEYAKNLTHLDVASNSITSISVLQSLTKLVHINIEDNEVTDIGVLTDLTDLQYIYVGGNPITDLSPMSNRPLAGASWPAVEPKEPSSDVNIFDANLAASIRKTLSLENDASITETDMERLTILTATNSQISSLSGLQYAKNLTRLDVSNNEIWSVSPITRLRKLTHLNLSQNEISSVYGLHWIEGLRVLKLAGNSIDIKDAAPLLLLEKLSEVDIKLPTQVNVPDRALAKILRSKLSITSKIPITQEALQTITDLANNYIREGYRQGADEIEDLTGLEHATAMTTLSLPYHGVSNITALQSLTQLTSLDFSNNYELSNYTHLSGLTNLTSLNLVNTYISDITPLRGLIKLTALNIGEDFYGSPFRESELSNISPLTNLTELTSLKFSKTKVHDISHLSGLTKLTSLDISRTKVSNISTLSNLTKLESLYLSGNKIADISPLTSLTNLGFLTLNGNPVVNTLPLCPLLRANGGNLFYVDIEVLNCPPQQINNAPVFTEEDSTTRNVAENTGHTAVPKSTSLLANFPNPFNPETWIPYQLAKPSEVTITIFDVRGRVVRTLILGTQSAGIYRSRSKAAHWDGKNTSGEKVAGGLYFYMLTAGDFSATRKMLILK